MSEITALAARALRRQVAANAAWKELALAYENAGAPWATVLNCLLAAGLTMEEIRIFGGPSPTVLESWFSGTITPPPRLRKVVFEKLIARVADTLESVQQKSKYASIFIHEAPN